MKFKGAVEDEVESAEVLEVEDEVAAESEKSEDLRMSECKRECFCLHFVLEIGVS